MATKKANPGKTEKKPSRAKTVITFAPVKYNDCTITQKRSGRYAVVNSKGINLNGLEKEKLLLDAKILKGSFKKSEATV